MNTKCPGCSTSRPLDFTFSMAFQPIVRADGGVWGYEALVRGTNGEGASTILDRVTAEQRYRFDQASRTKAIELAANLFPQGEGLHLSINFMPNAVYEPAACLRTTLLAAKRHQFPLDAILFEFTENEEVSDVDHLQRIITEYRRRDFLTAIDDFGAGHAGLGLLADFQPDLIKIDMKLVRNVHRSPARQVIITAIVFVAETLGITVLAEGIETTAEFEMMREAGVSLFQGYHFAKPAFEALPPVASTGLAIAA